MFSPIPGLHVVARCPQITEQLGRHQMDLAKVRKSRLSLGEISMPDVPAGVGVAFDPVVFHQEDAISRRFGEPVGEFEASATIDSAACIGPAP